MPESRTEVSEGNLEYQLLCNNDHQIYEYHHHSSFDIDSITSDGFNTHYVLIGCNEIRNKHLPNTANPRDPSPTGVVREMQYTLESEPEKFYQYNGGITIACTNVEILQDNKIKIEFGLKDGICNGGHTYFSVQTMDEIDEKAVLLLEILELPENMDEADRRKIIGEIARKRNKNRQLNTGTQLNHQGHFDIFKERIRAEKVYAESIEVPYFENDVDWENWIREVPEVYWYEGDPVAYPDNGANGNEEEPDRIKSSHFIRLLASMDPFLYSHHICQQGGNGTHQNTGTGDSQQGNLAKAIEEAISDSSKEIRKMRHMAPLAYDILKFRDLVSHDLAYGDYPNGYRNSKLWDWITDGKSQTDGYKLRRFTFDLETQYGHGLKAPDNFYPILFGLFRNNVWLGKSVDEGDIQYSGWYELLSETYKFSTTNENLKTRQLGKWKDFFSADEDAYTFIRNQNVYHQSWIDVRYGMIGMPAFPVKFYDVKNYQLQYSITENENDATHAMIYSAGKEQMFVQILEKDDEQLSNLDNGTDYQYYVLDEREDLVPENMKNLGLEIKTEV
jgi:hypothetical protein